MRSYQTLIFFTCFLDLVNKVASAVKVLRPEGYGLYSAVYPSS